MKKSNVENLEEINTIQYDQSNNNSVNSTPIEFPKLQTISNIYPKQSDSLFWCIYIARYGYISYTEIGHRYGNKEIEEKQQIIELMRSAPKKIKDCPKRITKTQYQEIMSDFMTNKKITIPMLIIYAIYSNLRIWIVNLNHSEIPDLWYMDIYSNETINFDPIIIYRKNNYKYGIVLLEGEQHTNLITKIKNELFCFDNYDEPLKAISNYKISDLKNIAEKIGIIIDTKWKKQELYDNILQKINLCYNV